MHLNFHDEQNFLKNSSDLFHTCPSPEDVPSSSDLCYQCKIHKGTFIHLFWSCDGIQASWKGVQSVIQQVISMQPSPSFYLLNYTVDKQFNTDTKSLLEILSHLAKKGILLWWSAPQTPKV